MTLANFKDSGCLVLNLPCPCGRPSSYATCCQPYLLAPLSAPEAETLMRSRYTAFTMSAADYLYQTWLPSKRDPTLLTQLQQDFAQQPVQWLGLNVLAVQHLSEEEATVLFFARYQQQNQRGFIFERSRFLRQQEHWYYSDGLQLKPERNHPCPCGSALKFKRCCA
jgi:SEC-C motif domain protein